MGSAAENSVLRPLAAAEPPHAPPPAAAAAAAAALSAAAASSFFFAPFLPRLRASACLFGLGQG